MLKDHKIRVALLDLYEGVPNQGMRCLRDILTHYRQKHRLDLDWKEFEVRLEKQVPGLEYDIFISTGGPGSPLDSEKTEWENRYFDWLDEVREFNRRGGFPKKKIFFICHSFQLACRHYGIARVTRRKSTAFGVFPMHLESWGKKDPLFAGLPDPFYGVDSRDYQVIRPDLEKLQSLGAHVLSIEKDRPHVPLERAVMAIRFDEHTVGTQFHPEADPVGMSMYLQRDDKKNTVIAEHGEPKWLNMIEQLNDPDKIRCTYSHVIPNFLHNALEQFRA